MTSRRLGRRVDEVAGRSRASHPRSRAQLLELGMTPRTYVRALAPATTSRLQMTSGSNELTKGVHVPCVPAPRRARARSPRSPATSPTPTAPRLRGLRPGSRRSATRRTSRAATGRRCQIAPRSRASPPAAVAANGTTATVRSPGRDPDSSMVTVGKDIEQPSTSGGLRRGRDSRLRLHGTVRGTASTSSSISARKASRSRRLKASRRRTTSTFSCDIAYSDSPTASRASA